MEVCGSVWKQYIRVMLFTVRLFRRGRKCKTFLSLEVCKQCQYIPFSSKTACPICVSGGEGRGGQFKQLHLSCALKGNRVHKTTRPSRHTRASVKLPPRHGVFVRVKETSEFEQTCGGFDIAENYGCKLLGCDTVQFGRRP